MAMKVLNEVNAQFERNECYVFILIFHFERLQVKVNMLFMAKLD